MAKSFSQIKPITHQKTKLVLSEYSTDLEADLADLTAKLKISRRRADKLLRTIKSGKDNVRRAVYLFHLGRGFEAYGYESVAEFVKVLPKRCCYYMHLRLAIVECNIKPFGVIGTTNSAILKELDKLGRPIKVVSSRLNAKQIFKLGKPTKAAGRLQHKCWIQAQQIAKDNHQHVSLEIVKKVVYELEPELNPKCYLENWLYD